MKAITVLGGFGFVGSHYWNSLDASTHDPNWSSRNHRDDYEIYTPNVINFISTVHNYNIFDNSHLDIDTNLNVLMTTLDNWRKFARNVKSADCVYNLISSWFVYGNQQVPEDVKEDAICDPKGFYSITKRCAEQLLISYCETFGLNYRILRLANVVGPGDKKVSQKKNALQYLINEIKAERDIEVYNDGRFYRDYIHIEDCVNAINLVIDQGKYDEIYNIGNGQSWYFADILYYARRVLGSKSMIKFIKPKEFHDLVQIKSFYMNIDKLTSLGYNAKYLGENLYNTLLA